MEPISFDQPFAEVVKEMNRKSSIEARTWYEEKRARGIGRTLLKMVYRFAIVYFIQGKIFKGFMGLAEAKTAALYELITYAKYWELMERQKWRM